MASEKVPSAARLRLLEAAVKAFARGGYFGTSTADVAREAGVSQPYVIRTFGTKESLFIEAHATAGRKMLEVFSSAISSSNQFELEYLGIAYRQLVMENRDELQIYSHGFSAGKVPAIAAESRRLFLEVLQLLQTAGASPIEIREFMGRGLLINTLLLIDLPAHATSPDIGIFLKTVFGR